MTKYQVVFQRDSVLMVIEANNIHDARKLFNQQISLKVLS